MAPLNYLKMANTHKSRDPASFDYILEVNLITNFTDEVLKKLLIGVALERNIFLNIRSVPYKQYHLYLKDKESTLWRNPADITFILFDINPYIESAFFPDSGHFTEIMKDIKTYSVVQKGPVVMSTFPLPYRNSYGNHFKEHPLFSFVTDANLSLHDLAINANNLYLLEINRLLALHGETNARDARNMHAFDIPFSNSFFLALGREFFAYIQALLGQTRKCIVVDLDGVLWGGIVGEVGPLGIAVGPEYPGNVYQNFQRILLELRERGTLLAINSRNNLQDALEVFKENPHMILREEHFAAIKANWNNKAQNLIDIAKELNIGLDHMVFLDDDPVNRELVKLKLPQVLVPDLSVSPEGYASQLLSLNAFTQFKLTEEDRKRGQMYAEEQKRKIILESVETIDDYIEQLKIAVVIDCNTTSLIPRLSQMTLKTNQFNITTRRYSEKNIESHMTEGLVFSGTISDKFGQYGTTILSILRPTDNSQHMILDSFLMSCRVMGRGIEHAFFNYIARQLTSRGVLTLEASFIPTEKNHPAKDFLPEAGFRKEAEESSKILYRLNIPEYLNDTTIKIYNTIVVKPATK